MVCLKKNALLIYFVADDLNNAWFPLCSGPGSLVSIATDYGLDGPGIESR